MILNPAIKRYGNPRPNPAPACITSYTTIRAVIGPLSALAPHQYTYSCLAHYREHRFGGLGQQAMSGNPTSPQFWDKVVSPHFGTPAMTTRNLPVPYQGG